MRRDAIDPLVIDTRRSFWGNPQLTDYEVQVIRWSRKHSLRVVMDKGTAEFWSGKRKIRRETAKRLIALKYLLPLDPPLLPGLLAQSYAPRTQ